MMYETTVAELVSQHANALLVGASSAGVVIVGARLLVDRSDGSPNILNRDLAANLAAWLIMVGGLRREDLDPVFEAQGVPPPWGCGESA